MASGDDTFDEIAFKLDAGTVTVEEAYKAAKDYLRWRGVVEKDLPALMPPSGLTAQQLAPALRERQGKIPTKKP